MYMRITIFKLHSVCEKAHKVSRTAINYWQIGIKFNKLFSIKRKGPN